MSVSTFMAIHQIVAKIFQNLKEKENAKGKVRASLMSVTSILWRSKMSSQNNETVNYFGYLNRFSTFATKKEE